MRIYGNIKNEFILLSKEFIQLLNINIDHKFGAILVNILEIAKILFCWALNYIKQNDAIFY